MQAGSLSGEGLGSYTTTSLDVHASAAGVAGADVPAPNESDSAASGANGITNSASSAGAQFGMVASNRLMRFPCLNHDEVRERGHPQVYDEYDDNVLRSATLHGCRALPMRTRPQ